MYQAGHLAGRFTDTQAFVLWVAASPSWLHLTLRLVSGASSIGTLLIVFRLTVRLSDRATALAATFFLAIAYLPVREAHFGLVDSSLTLLIAGTVLLLIESLDRPRSLLLLAYAGVVAGAATSIKYNAGALIIVALITSTLRSRRYGWKAALAGLGLWAFAFGATAVAGTPYALIDFGTFARDVSLQVARLSEGHGVRLVNGWSHNLLFSLTDGLGVPLLWTGSAGIPVMFARDWQRALIVWAYPLTYFVVIGGGHTGFVRYSLPMVPFITIGAAFAIRALAQVVTRSREPAGALGGRRGCSAPGCSVPDDRRDLRPADGEAGHPTRGRGVARSPTGAGCGPLCHSGCALRSPGGQLTTSRSGFQAG